MNPQLNTKHKYLMSFSTGGLFHQESVTLTSLYLELGDWGLMRDKVITENLLQTRTMASLKRILREATSRLKNLSGAELEFLVESSSQDQAYLLG